MDDRESLGQEARELRRKMARVRERLRFFEPWDRRATEEEGQEIQRLYVELGKLTADYSRVWQYGGIEKFQCPCCRLYTLDERPPGSCDICLVCWWEEDPLQFDQPDYRGGANRESLNEARETFRRHGITGPR